METLDVVFGLLALLAIGAGFVCVYVAGKKHGQAMPTRDTLVYRESLLGVLDQWLQDIDSIRKHWIAQESRGPGENPLPLLRWSDVWTRIHDELGSVRREVEKVEVGG